MTVPDDDVGGAVAQAHRSEWGGGLAAVARLLDGDLGTAEECTQDVFATLWRRAGEYDATRGRLSTWLFAIGKNVAAV